MKKFFATLMLCVIALQSFAAFVGGRTDFRDETIYFVMTTRFYDGDNSNNTYCWNGNKDAEYQDPNWRGDFKGLIEKLDYIKALGFTAVWITPIVENASGFDYHGYHASDFSKVDKRYESSDCSFQDLIDAAHARGMKIILDIVINHTGNFGEANLCKLFTRDWTKPQSDINQCMVPYTKSQGGLLQDNYLNLPDGQQYSDRLTKMKNTDGVNHDNHNLWHHYGNFNWDEPNRWWAQIAGDCVDLNTENPQTYQYLIDCYGSFIKMGVDGFRIDTGGHISRLTFNSVFVPAFQKLGEQYKSKRLNGCPFYMYAEVCARFQGSVTYRDQPALSPYFYTWQSPASLLSQWNNDGSYWDNVTVMDGTDPATLDNQKLCLQEASTAGGAGSQPKSNNAWLNGNEYHKPDYSKASGLNVIDFPVHYSFNSVGQVWGLFGSDNYYNDATYNVVYVDSHDYCPGSNDGTRFNHGTDQWAENMSLMFTFRGIPCVYYGSEIEFRKGVTIDEGPNLALKNSGRAYYGGYITGDVQVSDFGKVSSASGNVKATLSYPLVRHLQRLNQIRQAVPALRKGQYSTNGCNSNGGYAFKRRYTEGSTDSYVLCALNSGATFTGVLNGTYTDAVTGDKITVSNGTLTTPSFSGKGNMRIYVLNGPGKIGEDEPYMYGGSKPASNILSWDGNEEAGDPTTQYITGGGSVTPDPVDLEVYTPTVEDDEYSVFLEAPLTANNVTTWVWGAGDVNYTGGQWPGQQMQLMGTNADKTRKIFKWTYEGNVTTMPTNIIFVVNGNQTSDLVYKNHGYYIDSNWDHEVTSTGGGTTAPTLSVDKNSGTYEGELKVTITASDANATIVYTTDGSKPTANSKHATGKVTLTFTENTTLTAGVLHEGNVRNIVTREYKFKKDQPEDGYYTPIVAEDDYSVFFEAPMNANNITTWVWGSNVNYTGGQWPGQAMQYMGTNKAGDRKIYKWTYEGNLTTMPQNIIFVVDGTQTSDLVYKNHGYYIGENMDHEVTNYEASAPTLDIDKESGRYNNKLDVTITASYANAIIVYTLDGTTPTADSQRATGKVTLTLTDNTTLTAGVLFQGKVRNVVSREYIFHGFAPYKATIYLKDPFAAPNNWNALYFYAWDNDGQLLGGWPGVQQTATTTVNGDVFYYQSFDINSEDYVFNIIFNQGDGNAQTVDITGLNKDTFFEISSTTNKYTVNDITDQYTSTSTPGDVNGDGVIDVSDVNLIINVMLGKSSNDKADVNGDGNVDVSDVNAVINLMLGK